MKIETCKTCGAGIHWVEMANGKRHPVDADSAQRRISCTREGEGGRVEVTYRSHFATCPDAEQHRRR